MKLNLIMAVDTTNYEIRLIQKLVEVYSKSAKIHISVMGKNPNQIEKEFKFENAEVQFSNEPYNYSKAINNILNKLDKDDICMISDQWSMFSMWQVLYEGKNLNYDDKFVLIKSLYSDELYPFKIKYDTTRFLSGVMNKMRKLKVKTEAPGVLICKAELLTGIVGGLNLDFSSSTSRSQLAYQLKKLGLEEHLLSKSGLTLYNQKIQSENDYEFTKLNKYRYNNQIFIKNNIKSPNHIIPSGINQELVTKKKHENERVQLLSKMRLERKEKKETKIMINKNQNVDPKKILVCMSSDIKYIMSSTPLLKELYVCGYNVDILLDSKTEESVSLLPSFFTNTLYDTKDINAKYVDFPSYFKIIKTAGCNISLSSKISYSGIKTFTDPTRSNLKLIHDLKLTSSSLEDLYRIPPMCDYITTKRNIPTNTILINVGLKTSSRDYWIDTNNMISTLSKKNRNRNMIVSLKSEKIKPDIFNSFTGSGIIINKNLTMLEIAGMLKKCSLYISVVDSDTNWIAYGLKTNSIIINQNAKLPQTPWMNIIKPDNKFQDINTIPIGLVMGEIWKQI